MPQCQPISRGPPMRLVKVRVSAALNSGGRILYWSIIVREPAYNQISYRVLNVRAVFAPHVHVSQHRRWTRRQKFGDDDMLEGSMLHLQAVAFLCWRVVISTCLYSSRGRKSFNMRNSSLLSGYSVPQPTMFGHLRIIYSPQDRQGLRVNSLERCIR